MARSTASSSLLAILGIVRPAFSAAMFGRFVVIATGWLLTGGDHAVTQALVETGLSGRLHHAAFHRFFSRARWNVDFVGELLFRALCARFHCELTFVIDDTLCPHKGPQIFGLGCHLDPVLSNRGFRVVRFGLCWVVLSLRVQFPFSRRSFSLPLLFRLYRQKSRTPIEEQRKKTQLARELLCIAAGWCGKQRCTFAVDNAFSCREVLFKRPKNATVLGALKTNNVLYALPAPRRPHQKGRQPMKGERLGSIAELAENDRYPWRKRAVSLDGRKRRMKCKTLVALWPTSCPGETLCVVIVKCENGDRPLRAFFSTASTWGAVEVLEGFSGRWSIEVAFRDTKQLLGLSESRARTKLAVERTTPFVGLLLTLLVLWFADSAAHQTLVPLPIRPWYRHKSGFCVSDMLRAVRSTLRDTDISEACGLVPHPEKVPRTPRRRHAAAG